MSAHTERYTGQPSPGAALPLPLGGDVRWITIDGRRSQLTTHFKVDLRPRPSILVRHPWRDPLAKDLTGLRAREPFTLREAIEFTEWPDSVRALSRALKDLGYEAQAPKNGVRYQFNPRSNAAETSGQAPRNIRVVPWPAETLDSDPASRTPRQRLVSDRRRAASPSTERSVSIAPALLGAALAGLLARPLFVSLRARFGSVSLADRGAK